MYNLTQYEICDKGISELILKKDWKRNGKESESITKRKILYRGKVTCEKEEIRVTDKKEKSLTLGTIHR